MKKILILLFVFVLPLFPKFVTEKGAFLVTTSGYFDNTKMCQILVCKIEQGYKMLILINSNTKPILIGAGDFKYLTKLVGYGTTTSEFYEVLIDDYIDIINMLKAMVKSPIIVVGKDENHIFEFNVLYKEDIINSEIYQELVK